MRLAPVSIWRGFSRPTARSISTWQRPAARPGRCLADLGDGWQQSVDHETRQLRGRPGVYVSEAGLGSGQSVVGLVAEGRRVALDMWRHLEGAGA